MPAEPLPAWSHPEPNLHPTGPTQSLALFLARAGGVNPNDRQGKQTLREGQQPAQGDRETGLWGCQD